MKTKNEFKIRASGASNIMGVKALGKTGETYLKEWTKQQLYKRRKDISSKYLTKGLEMEDAAIEFVANELFNGAMMFKNEEYFNNDFFTGTPDLIHDNKIIDIKCSWDCFTFPLFETELPDKNYFYQMQVYMELTGLEQAEVIYCLMNTPESLLYGQSEDLHNYDNIKNEHRIKRFTVLRDQEVIDKLKSRVIESRGYIKTL